MKNELRRGFPKLLAACLLALVTGTHAAGAQAPQDTLEHIRETGVLRIAYGNSPPFSYKLADGSITGYSIEICQNVAEDLKEQLHLDRLDIEYVPRTASNRVQLLRDGAFDIECASSTATEERKRVADFALSHFFAGVPYVSLAKNGISSLSDLNGRTISVPAGTVNVGQINAVNREMKLNMNVLLAKDLAEAFEMVTTERAVAMPMDDVLLKMMIERSKTPSAYALSTEYVAPPEPYGFMMRREDDAFEEAVNASLRKLYASPVIHEIYTRWFEQPIPGVGINLALPMSDTLEQWFSQF